MVHWSTGEWRQSHMEMEKFRPIYTKKKFVEYVPSLVLDG
jgi:hypothetical protein